VVVREEAQRWRSAGRGGGRAAATDAAARKKAPGAGFGEDRVLLLLGTQN